MADSKVFKPGAILVVDDVPANLSVLLDFLGDAGFEVLVAESGQGALDQIGYSRPDIILLDVMMPGLDGFEVCRRLKADAGFRDIPVIFMTALTETVDKVKGFEAGAVDFVSKPVQPEEVLARVQAHLEIRHLQRVLEEKNRELEHEILLRLEAEDQLQQSLDQAVIVATRDHRIQFCTRHAWDLLSRYFSAKILVTLPEAIETWIAGGVRPEGSAGTGGAKDGPLVITRDRGTLTVRLFSEGDSSQTVMLLLDEKVEINDPKPLEQLGLTPREAEVLFWMTQGKSSPEIAVILEAAPNTVKKHVQNIFQKLGVENRTAAALRALEVIGLPDPGI
ncbi:MAG: response regulator transcription factor [Opitutaceae bacterium]